MKYGVWLIGLIILSSINTVFAQATGLEIPQRTVRKQLKKLGCSRDYKLNQLRTYQENGGNEHNQGDFFAIEDQNGVSRAAYLYLGRVNTCRSGGCLVHYGKSGGQQFEFFDYFIIFSKTFEIEAIKVFRYEATHGQEITARYWLKQFRGYSGINDLVVGKDIDGITGATTSVYNITYDIQEKTRELKKLIWMEYCSSSYPLTLCFNPLLNLYIVKFNQD